MKFENYYRLDNDKTFHKDNLKETWVWTNNFLRKQILSKSIKEYQNIKSTYVNGC